MEEVPLVAEIRKDGTTVHIYQVFSRSKGNHAMCEHCSLSSQNKACFLVPTPERALSSGWPTTVSEPCGSSSRRGEISPQTLPIWIMFNQFRNKSVTWSLSLVPKAEASPTTQQKIPSKLCYLIWSHISHCNLHTGIEMLEVPHFDLVA